MPRSAYYCDVARLRLRENCNGYLYNAVPRIFANTRPVTYDASGLLLARQSVLVVFSLIRNACCRYRRRPPI